MASINSVTVMPDEDWIDRTPAKYWRKTFNLLNSGVAFPHEIAKSATSSLCRSLRNEGGIPGATEIFNVVQRQAHNELTLPEAFEELRHTELRFSGHRNTRVAVVAAQKMAARVDNGDRTEPSAKEFMLSVINEMLEHHPFGRAKPNSVSRVHNDSNRLLIATQESKQQMQEPLGRIATKLAEDPSAAKLIAPRGRKVTHQTSELLSLKISVPELR